MKNLIFVFVFLPFLLPAQDFEGICPVTGKEIYYRMVPSKEYVQKGDTYYQETVSQIEANCIKFSFSDTTYYIHEIIGEDISFLLQPRCKKLIADFVEDFSKKRKKEEKRRAKKAKLSKDYTILQKRIELWELEGKDAKRLEIKADSLWYQLFIIGASEIDGNYPIHHKTDSSIKTKPNFTYKRS